MDRRRKAGESKRQDARRSPAAAPQPRLDPVLASVVRYLAKRAAERDYEKHRKGNEAREPRAGSTGKAE